MKAMPKAKQPTITKKAEERNILPVKKRKRFKRKKRVTWNPELCNFKKADLVSLRSSASRVPAGKSILKPRTRLFKTSVSVQNDNKNYTRSGKGH